MNEHRAELNNYRQSPRKVRLVANLLKGKSVFEAKSKIAFIIKRSALPLKKLLNSAIANGKNLGAKEENLWIKSVKVDSGKILYRRRMASRGRVSPIHKRTSHVSIILVEKPSNEAKKSKKVSK